MTPEEARRLLQAHSGRDAETDPAKWENGFLVPHRYSPDHVSEASFLEVMECIKTLAPEIAASRTVDRELMAALWGLIYFPRVWAFSPRAPEHAIRDGRRMFDSERLSRLADQLDRIAEAVDYALNAMPESVRDAMIGYGEPLPGYVDVIRSMPNQTLHVTGHADDGSARHDGDSRVSRHVNWVVRHQ